MMCLVFQELLKFKTKSQEVSLASWRYVAVFLETSKPREEQANFRLGVPGGLGNPLE